MDNQPLLECQLITKSFGNNHVLKEIDLKLFKGDVVAVIGGNGAGKSTLMKIIMGIYQADSGKIFVSGNELKKITPSTALQNGIYLVPQEPMLFPNMTVEENVLLGLSGKRSDNKKKLENLIIELGWKLDLNRKANTLSIAEQQLVEITKGLIRESKILILDEPTSSLTFNEIQSLFKIIDDLQQKDVGIIYITHRLNEVFEIATKVCIMRDGKITLEGPIKNFNNEMLIEALLPEDTEHKNDNFDKKEYVKNENAVLELKNVTGNGFSNVSFTVYEGEILGLAGIVGAGRTEIAQTIFGRDKLESGTVCVSNVDISNMSTEDVIANGLNYVPEDRFKHGIFKISDIGMNISSASLKNMGKFWLDKDYEVALYEDYKKSFVIKSTGINQEMGSLSGGNQQKIVIARALATNPKILILDEPTRGIDAVAREDVYKIIYRLKEKGLSILLISSDIEEITKLSDRAVTMHRGKINGEFTLENITPDNIISASFGVMKEVAE